jgi:hypothetical protein
VLGDVPQHLVPLEVVNMTQHRVFRSAQPCV